MSKNIKLFDSHAHLGLIHSDVIELIIIAKKALNEGVAGIMNICHNLGDFDNLYKTLKTISNIYFSVGVSPSEVMYTRNNWLEFLEERLTWNRVLAIGDIGLDYVKSPNHALQREFFINQLELAMKFDFPIIIHNRGAKDDIYKILMDYNPRQNVVFHCFSEDINYAEKLWKKGYFLSFSANVGYKNSKYIREIVKEIPEHLLLIESESPFMSPLEYLGKRNKPFYLPATFSLIQQIREQDPDDLAQVIYQNSLNFFRLNS